jgi:hypothetical protein
MQWPRRRRDLKLRDSIRYAEPDSRAGGITAAGSVANVTHVLKGIGFPARELDLLDRAKKNHAERAVLDIVGAMLDQDYRTMADVMKDFGKARWAGRSPSDFDPGAELATPCDGIRK